MLDADGDGRITRKEYEACFNLLDTDGDGVITREEFNGASGAPFAMLDKNSDGTVSRAEWNAGFDSFDTGLSVGRPPRGIARGLYSGLGLLVVWGDDV